MAKTSLSLFLFFIFIFCITYTVEPSSSSSSSSSPPSSSSSSSSSSSMARARHSGYPRARASFIEASCMTTRYPALCLKCLSRYANSSKIHNAQQLAQVALTVSLYRARYTRSYMLKVAKELEAIKAKEYPAVRDCLQQIEDSVIQLSQSIRELRRLEHRTGMSDDIFLHINNVETWVSAALTDASFCVDEFPGRRMSKMKATIKGKVLNVAQLTSNALSLFHQYAARYRAAAATEKP